MSVKQIIGGYLPGTNSVRTHPIRNIIIKPEGWTQFILEVNNKTFNFENISKEVTINMNYNNDYKMVLYVNDLEIYQYPYIFHYTLTFSGNFDENCISYKQSMLYDS
jgi:hypothetical protein